MTYSYSCIDCMSKLSKKIEFKCVFSPVSLCSQGKEDFERQQKELLDKENIIKQSQVQLGQEQVRLLTITYTELLAYSVLLLINIYTLVRFHQTQSTDSS